MGNPKKLQTRQKSVTTTFFRELEGKIDGLQTGLSTETKKVESLDKGLATVSKKGAHCAYT